MPYPVDVLMKMVVASVLAGAVGWQRELRDRPAGLRTHVLVCVGATVYTLSSLSLEAPNADPGRIAAQVATGMGFLGAGTIIRYGTTVRGLTTAASLWAVAAIGITVGIGGREFWVAVLGTLTVLLTLTALRKAEQRMLTRGRYGEFTLRMRGTATGAQAVEKMLVERGAELRTIELTDVDEQGVQVVHVGARLPPGFDLAGFCSELRQMEGCLWVRGE